MQAMDEPQLLTSLRAILKVALPAILLNAAPTACTMLQTLLLGRFGSVAAVAAFAGVGITASALLSVFNFLSDGVSAKVGKSVGQQQWTQFAVRVKLALMCAVGAGALAAGLLAAAQAPVLRVLQLHGEELAVARPYWWCRVALIPLSLLNTAVLGVLQGYKRVGWSAALVTGQALAEMAGSGTVLAGGGAGRLRGLLGMGVCQLAVAAATAVAGLMCVVLLPPAELPPEHRLLAWRADTGGLGWPLLGEAQQPGQDGEEEQEDEVPDGWLVVGPRIASEGGGGGRGSGSGGGMAQRGSLASLALLVAGDDFWDFARDGANMLVRSVCLQATFFIGMLAAGRLGSAALPSRYVLAAHQVVNQLWLVTVYVVDGFAAAGVVLGSRLVGLVHAGDPAAMRAFDVLAAKTLALGLATGCAAGGGFWVWRERVIAAFTSDAGTRAVLTRPLWALLCAAQPVNALVFVYDGLMLAGQAFAYIRAAMLSGTLLVFLPAIAGLYSTLHGLVAVWGAKAALNVWRGATGAHYVHRALRRKAP